MKQTTKNTGTGMVLWRLLLVIRQMVLLSVMI